jgi:hypothetical protein
VKIVTESADQLVASDKEIGQLIAAPVVVVVGLLVVLLGLTNHVVVGDVIGLVLLLAGALMILTRKVRTLTVDRASGSVHFSLKSITKKGSYDYKVQDIAKIQLLSQYQTTNTNSPSQNSGTGISFGTGGAMGMGNTQTQQTTKLVLVLKDGTSIDIADGSRSMSTMGVFSSVPNQGVGQKIAQFMGVPFENVGPESLGQAVSEIAGAIRGGSQPPLSVTQPPAAPVSPVPPVASDSSHIGVPDQPGFAAIRPPATQAPTAPPAPAPVSPPDVNPPAPPDSQQ